MGWLKNIVRYYAPPGYIKDERARACCSFCGKSYRQVGPLIEGPNGVYICDQCIDLCRSIMDAERRRRGTNCPMCGAAVRVIGRCAECGEVFGNPSSPNSDGTPESN